MNLENKFKKQKFSLDNNNMINKSKESLKDYKIEKIIAKNSFGKVNLGIHKKTNEKVC